VRFWCSEEEMGRHGSLGTSELGEQTGPRRRYSEKSITPIWLSRSSS
jgi:hypothetical protein